MMTNNLRSLTAVTLLALGSLGLVACADPDEPVLGSTTQADGANDAPTKESSFVEDCSGVFTCTSLGTLVLHREGTSCVLGDVVLAPNRNAQYRETIELPPYDDVTITCKRKD